MDQVTIVVFRDPVVPACGRAAPPAAAIPPMPASRRPEPAPPAEVVQPPARTQPPSGSGVHVTDAAGRFTLVALAAAAAVSAFSTGRTKIDSG